MTFDRTKHRREWGQNNKDRLSELNAADYTKHKGKRANQSKQYRDKIKKTFPEMVMIRQSRHRAKKRKLEFDITVNDIHIPERCPILDIPLYFTSGKITPNTPSVDIINSSNGYIRGNIRVISNRANTIKNNANIEEIQLVLKDLILLENTYE